MGHLDDALKNLFPDAQIGSTENGIKDEGGLEIRGIIEIDVLYGVGGNKSTKVTNSTVDTSVSIWAYQQNSAEALADPNSFYATRYMIPLCLVDGCEGSAGLEYMVNGSGGFFCNLCNEYHPASAPIVGQSYYRTTRDDLANKVAKMWLLLAGHVDILAVVHKVAQMKSVQSYGVHGGNSALDYRRALRRTQDRESARYHYPNICADIAAGSTLRDRVRAFLGEL